MGVNITSSTDMFNNFAYVLLGILIIKFIKIILIEMNDSRNRENVQYICV